MPPLSFPNYRTILDRSAEDGQVTRRRRRLILSGLLAVAVIALVIVSRGPAEIRWDRQCCDVTGSFRKIIRYTDGHRAIEFDPSPLESEALRRGIAVDHDWQTTESNWRTSWNREWHAYSSYLSTAPSFSKEQVAAMSDEEIRRNVTRHASSASAE